MDSHRQRSRSYLRRAGAGTTKSSGLSAPSNRIDQNARGLDADPTRYPLGRRAWLSVSSLASSGLPAPLMVIRFVVCHFDVAARPSPGGPDTSPSPLLHALHALTLLLSPSAPSSPLNLLSAHGGALCRRLRIVAHETHYGARPSGWMNGQRAGGGQSHGTIVHRKCDALN